jgi:hypothetical protein
MPKKYFIWLFISTARKYRISLDLGGHIPSHFCILLCKEKEKNNYYSLNWGCRDHMEVKSAKQRQKNRNRLDKLAAVAMATKKGGFKKNLDSFHQTS